MNKLLSLTAYLRHLLYENPCLRLKRLLHARAYGQGSDPLISIIIATYNRGRILTERTIPSIMAQTYQNFEIVIVGDHCIDNTAELLNEVRDSRIRFYDLPERGTYPSNPKDRWFVQGVAPRNKGLEIARGDWFCWISDDDLLCPSHFETMLRFAQSGNYEFVSASYTCEVDGEIVTRFAADYDPPIGGMQTWLYRSYLRFFRWNISSWRKNWNRPCDYDLQDRMFRAGVRMGFTSEVVAHVPAVEGTTTIGWRAQDVLAEQEV